MQITKDMLSKIDYVKLELENCESFKVPNKKILDIWFDDVYYQ